MEKKVFLLGETLNPYPYMKGADYLLHPSIHEAAPMVFDEAKVLGLPILSTDTTSAKEMLAECDIVCENSVQGLQQALLHIQKAGSRGGAVLDNELQIAQFECVLA